MFRTTLPKTINKIGGHRIPLNYLCEDNSLNVQGVVRKSHPSKLARVAGIKTLSNISKPAPTNKDMKRKCDMNQHKIRRSWRYGLARNTNAPITENSPGARTHTRTNTTTCPRKIQAQRCISHNNIKRTPTCKQIKNDISD